MRKFSILLFLLSSPMAVAQHDSDAALEKNIHRMDSIFWKSYNQCNVEGMVLFFTNDVEFYHDKGGLTEGLKKMEEALKTGLCGGSDWRLRRQAIPGTVKIYPLGDYGAIISGEHVFYIIEGGLPPRLDGQARFTHVWMKQEDESWKMRRILSYDHHPATYRPSKP